MKTAGGRRKALCNCKALRMSECCRSDTFLKGNAKTVDFEGLESLAYLYKMGGNRSFPPISSKFLFLFWLIADRNNMPHACQTLAG